MAGAYLAIRRPSPAQLAGVLLLVLLAHLGLMVTPVHAAATHATTTSMMGAEDADALSHARVPGGAALDVEGGSGHCAMAWALTPAGRSVPALGAAALATRALPSAGEVAARTPIPRVLGPPLLGDGQALLQVFRI